MDTEQEAALLSRAGVGDERALAQLYDAHADAMFALAMQLLRERSAAEDLVHDVFVEAWQRAADYNPQRGSVRTWLVLRVRSRGLDRLRQQKMATDKQRQVADAVEPSEPANPAASADYGRLHELINDLTQDQRQVLMFSYFRGLSSGEIARRLELPVGTVKSRLAAALARLRRHMDSGVTS